MGNGQMGTARGEEVAEAAGGGETGGAVERERLAELRVLLCTRVHEVRTARTSERTSTRTNTEYISNRSGQRAQRLRWRLIGGATRTRTRVCDVGHESDQRADRRDHQQRNSDALPVLAFHFVLEELLRAASAPHLCSCALTGALEELSCWKVSTK